MSSNDDRKNIVIVGGGQADAAAARELSGKLDAIKYNLILINARPYQIFLIATLRIVVSPVDDLQSDVFLPYDKLFINGNGTFVHGTVSAITDNGSGGVVSLESGDEVKYDYLVLATGLKWEGPVDFPDKPEDVDAFIGKYRAALEKANDIVLVGGGAVGIEFAGEIKDIYPNKPVTIVHGLPALLNPAYPDKFRRSMLQSVHARGVDVVLDDFVEAPFTSEGGSITTRKGKIIKADLVLQTTGPRPSPKLPGILSSLASNSESLLTPRGFLRVESTLQLPGRAHIFAAGDLIDWAEQKSAQKAGAHTGIVVKNILASLEGAELVRYKGSYEMVFITNGKTEGRGYFGILWGITVGAWVVCWAKSRELLVPMFKKNNGY